MFNFKSTFIQMKIKKYLFSFLILLLMGCKSNETVVEEGFSFAFLTDIHLSLDNESSYRGFRKAIESAKQNNAAFILTGGDNMDIDYLGNNPALASDLYTKYMSVKETAGIDIFSTIGNHDMFMPNDTTWEENMYEKYIKDAYYSFNYNGWYFFVLNTSRFSSGQYSVDAEQKEWLRVELGKTDRTSPIILSVHVPFLSVHYPFIEGRYTSTDTFSNFKEIWDMFTNHNVRRVLQGHMHIYEEIMVNNIQFITGGAVSGAWWDGPYYGTEEGYLMVHITGDNISWEYIDLGWEIAQ